MLIQQQNYKNLWTTNFIFSESDLDKKFHIDVPDLGGLLSKKKDWTLREINESFT